jgi:hypothetical protein
VNIDCFQCHNDNPVRPSQLTGQSNDQVAAHPVQPAEQQHNGNL